MSTPTVLPAAALDGVDLTDPRRHAAQELGPVFARLRTEAPLAWHPAPAGAERGFWVVSRHADAVAVLRDTAGFSSARGNMLTTLLADGDSAGNRMLVVSDAPWHTELRAEMRKAFTPRALAEIGERIRATARRVVREAAARGAAGEPVDMADDIAAHIPLSAICDLLGVPERDRAFILRQTSVALGSHEPVPATLEARLAQAEILMFFAKLARRRGGGPALDAISLLARAEVGARRLSEDELVLNCYSLILGGDETTRLSMVGGVHALAQRPEQWRRLRDGEVGTEGAVEEILRWTSPLLHAGRTATRDVDLHGHTVAAGDVVSVWLGSANRDERVFTAPDTFDPGRTPNRHVTFAHGPHFCLGAHLARIELGALLDALRESVTEIEPAGPPSPVYSAFVSGPAHLPVVLRPGAPRGQAASFGSGRARGVRHARLTPPDRPDPA
ncbi:cytochrome P450 [Streptomyces sp. NPDC101191]|uniref:cytochrome P450 n=1 Tax=Streptomyces sp. NPDC101191 TaxID=3366126 RepID=UPI00381AED89